ncbi:MAG: hypothetical protein P8Y93_15125 [Acidobacteriota bacterium]
MTRTARIFGTRGSLQRQYSVAAGVLLLLVLGIIFLFGHLIAGSLSRRYLEDVLAGGRDEARRIAEELGGEDATELDVIERRREVLTRTLEGDPERRIWESIEVTDSSGKIVFSSKLQSREEIPEELASDLELQGALSDQDVTETETPYRITVPIGEVGNVVLNVDRQQVASRVAKVRTELLTQTITIASLTLTTLIAAFVFVWLLIQRTRRLEAQRHEAEEMAALGGLAAKGGRKRAILSFKNPPRGRTSRGIGERLPLLCAAEPAQAGDGPRGFAAFRCAGISRGRGKKPRRSPSRPPRPSRSGASV